MKVYALARGVTVASITEQAFNDVHNHHCGIVLGLAEVHAYVQTQAL
jgi:hypothetical protein